MDSKHETYYSYFAKNKKALRGFPLTLPLLISVCIGFNVYFQAEGPPVQMEPVDLSIKTPVVLQVPRYPPQRLKNPTPVAKVTNAPPGESKLL